MSYLAPEGYSFHTFELTKSITYDELRDIKNRIYTEAARQKHRVVKKDNYTKCEIWSYQGVTIYLYENIDAPPHIKLIINPRTVLEEHEYIGIFKYNDVDMERIKSHVDMILSVILPGYCLESMTLSRIDLCVNIEFNDSSICSQYMRLIRKCNIPFPYHRECFLPDEANYKEKNKRSFRASRRDLTFTVYDKLFQLTEEGRLKSNRKVPKALLRVEAALRRPEILKYAREYLNGQSASNMQLFQMFGENSKSIMKMTVYEFFPCGVYTTYNVLCEYIEQLELHKKTKSRMLYLVKKTSDCKDLKKSIRETYFNLDLSPSQMKYLLDSFEDLDINPVTLPNTFPYLSLVGVREMLEYEE